MAENEFTCRTWRYGPNGEAEIFEDSRAVPEGWLDHPMKFQNPNYPHDAPAEEQDAPLAASRSEIIGQLKERGVTFRVSAKTDVLYALLMSHVERENETEE